MKIASQESIVIRLASLYTLIMIQKLLCFMLLFFLPAQVMAAPPKLPPASATLFQLAKDKGRMFHQAEALSPEIIPTTDNRSFLAIWKPVKNPQKWIVSIHGSNGYATDDLAIWYKSLKDRNVGLICLQWYLGGGPDDYYNPEQIYRQIDSALSSLSIKPGTVMFHGFSRGSANSYAVTALDHGRGKSYFALSVANSGGFSPDYPPNRAIDAGAYGKRPLLGTNWITAAGGKDPNPERDGIAAMRRTADWLKIQGATVIGRIEATEEGHGVLGRDPASAGKVVDQFLELQIR